MVRAINGGQVELYHNGTKKLQTDSAGTVFYDDTFLGDNLKANFGASADLQIYHDGSHSFIDSTLAGAQVLIRTKESGGSVYQGTSEYGC